MTHPTEEKIELKPIQISSCLSREGLLLITALMDNGSIWTWCGHDSPPWFEVQPSKEWNTRINSEGEE